MPLSPLISHGKRHAAIPDLYGRSSGAAADPGHASLELYGLVEDDSGDAERPSLSRGVLNAALLTDGLQNRVEQIGSPNVLKVKRVGEEGEDTRMRSSPMLDDKFLAAGSSHARPRPAANDSESAAQLFSGQFAQALESFTSPAKQPFSAHVDQNLWLQPLSGQTKGMQRDMEDENDDAEPATKNL